MKQNYNNQQQQKMNSNFTSEFIDKNKTKIKSKSYNILTYFKL